jgi:hypothetical protein
MCINFISPCPPVACGELSSSAAVVQYVYQCMLNVMDPLCQVRAKI